MSASVKTKLVCVKCGAKWPYTFNPATCPTCNQDSFGITVEDKQGGTS